MRFVLVQGHALDSRHDACRSPLRRFRGCRRLPCEPPGGLHPLARSDSDVADGVDLVGGDGQLEGLVVDSRSGRRRTRRRCTWTRRTGCPPRGRSRWRWRHPTGHGRGPAPSRTSGRRSRTSRASWCRCRATASSPTSGGSRSRGRPRPRRSTVSHPRKMSLALWTRRWPSTTRWPMLTYSTRPEERLGHRVLGLLDLEHQRVALVPTDEQGHPAAGPDRADADHLAGQVDELIAGEQVLTFAGQGHPVLDQGPVRFCTISASLSGVEELVRRDEQRRIGPEPQRPVHLLGQLGHRAAGGPCPVPSARAPGSHRSPWRAGLGTPAGDHGVGCRAAGTRRPGCAWSANSRMASR